MALKQQVSRRGPNFMALLTAEFCAYRRILCLRLWFPTYVQVSNFCASLVSLECLVTWSTHAQKPKFAANPWITLAVSTEFPASVSADSVLTVSRAMKLGPGHEPTLCWSETPELESCYQQTDLVFLYALPRHATKLLKLPRICLLLICIPPFLPHVLEHEPQSDHSEMTQSVGQGILQVSCHGGSSPGQNSSSSSSSRALIQ